MYDYLVLVPLCPLVPLVPQSLIVPLCSPCGCCVVLAVS